MIFTPSPFTATTFLTYLIDQIYSRLFRINMVEVGYFQTLE